MAEISFHIEVVSLKDQTDWCFILVTILFCYFVAHNYSVVNTYHLYEQTTLL